MLTVRARKLLTTAITIVMLTISPFAGVTRSTLAAPGEDVCPESNNSYETSCYLGPNADVYGFVQAQDDVDMYRVEPLEFGVTLHVALTEQPFPYRLTVYNWEGKVMRETSNGSASELDVKLGPPGSYYVVVDQLFVGQFSATAPYRLASELRYPGPIPDTIYSATFRAGGQEEDDYSESSNETAFFNIEKGRLTIRMKEGGSGDEPTSAGYWLPIDSMRDFTLSIDVRVVTDSDSGYDIMFRSPEDLDDETGYHVLVAPSEQRMLLRAYSAEDEKTKNFGKWVTSRAINPHAVNRIVVRARGDEILVNINGSELVHVRDATFNDGAISFEAVAWDETPPVVSFGNILVTTP